jgi:hypothetical protein
MKLQHLMVINAVAALAFGLAFALWGPAILLASGLNTIPRDNEMWFWTAGTFARLLGVALVGYGALAWAASRFAPECSACWEITLAFFLANALGCLITLIQQIAVWGSVIGAIGTIIYFLLAVGFGYFLLMRPTPVRLDQ